MALSNYYFSTIEGVRKESGGFHVTKKNGLDFHNISVYKNWLNFERNGEYIGQITQGNASIEGTYLLVRIDNNQTFFIAQRYDDMTVFFGACGYGYKGEEWVGLTKPNAERLLQFLEKNLPFKVPADVKDHFVGSNGENLSKKKMGFTVAEVLGA